MNVCKGNPTGPVWLDPQTDCLDGVSREPNYPWECPERVSETYCNLRGKNFVQVLTFTIGMVYCLVDLIWMYCID